MNRFAVVVMALLLTACIGSPFRWQDTDRIHDGMTEAEVIAILSSKPFSRSQVGNRTILMWNYVPFSGTGRAVSYSFLDGRVVGQTTVGR